MRKIISLVVAIVVCGCYLTGCKTEEEKAKEKLLSAIDDITGNSSDNDDKSEKDSNKENEKDSNKIEYGEKLIYESSNCRIYFNSIEYAHKAALYRKSSAYDAVDIEIMVENLSDEKISTYSGSYSLSDINMNINDFEITTSSFDKFNLSGKSKEVQTIKVGKDALEKSKIQQIESIKLDCKIKIGSDDDKEEIINAEIKLDEPYVLNWE